MTNARTLFASLASLIIIVAASASSASGQVASGIPHLERQGSAMHLIVKGKPLLMLAGETGNSSASDLEYMNTIWPKVVKMHLNALVVPVYWELVEPK